MATFILRAWPARTSREPCSSVSRSEYRSCTDVLISTMLWVISGLISPPGASRVTRRNRSSASGARLKSRVLTSISSSSTPIESASEVVKSSCGIRCRSVARARLAFTGSDQRVTRGDRSQDVQDRDARGDDRGQARAEFGGDLVNGLRHSYREAGNRRQREP